MKIKLAEPMAGADKRSFFVGATVDLADESFEITAVGDDWQTLELRPLGDNGLVWDAPNNIPRFQAGSRLTDFRR